jgi:2-polyprenyl-3-methyl-5-hydroxy-6-metoxy-1,4-benzoquinol methylase
VEPDLRPCPACGASATAGGFSASDHREGVPGGYRVVVCAACGSGRTHPVPDDLAAVYPDSYQQHNVNALTARVVARGITRAASGGAVASLLARVLPDAELGGPVPAGMRVLDVGAGNGNAVRALCAAGADAHGVEPGESAVTAARAAGAVTVRQGTLETSPLRAERWDMIRFFHVLEHVPDPRGTLAAAHGALVPDGRLVVGVPNFGALARRVLGASWDGLEVPRHLTHFTARGLRALLAATGFEVTSLRTTPLFGVLPGSLDARTAGGRRQRGWGDALPVRVATYPLEILLAELGVGDGLIAVSRPR